MHWYKWFWLVYCQKKPIRLVRMTHFYSCGARPEIHPVFSSITRPTMPRLELESTPGILPLVQINLASYNMPRINLYHQNGFWTWILSFLATYLTPLGSQWHLRDRLCHNWVLHICQWSKYLVLRDCAWWHELEFPWRVLATVTDCFPRHLPNCHWCFDVRYVRNQPWSVAAAGLVGKIFKYGQWRFVWM